MCETCRHFLQSLTRARPHRCIPICADVCRRVQTCADVYTHTQIYICVCFMCRRVERAVGARSFSPPPTWMAWEEAEDGVEEIDRELKDEPHLRRAHHPRKTPSALTFSRGDALRESRIAHVEEAMLRTEGLGWLIPRALGGEASIEELELTAPCRLPAATRRGRRAHRKGGGVGGGVSRRARKVGPDGAIERLVRMIVPSAGLGVVGAMAGDPRGVLVICLLERALVAERGQLLAERPIVVAVAAPQALKVAAL